MVKGDFCKNIYGIIVEELSNKTAGHLVNLFLRLDGLANRGEWEEVTTEQEWVGVTLFKSNDWLDFIDLVLEG